VTSEKRENFKSRLEMLERFKPGEGSTFAYAGSWLRDMADLQLEIARALLEPVK
jgi:hypothetical protein